MSELTHSKLETHETGTLSQAAIINANWRKIEAMLDPTLADDDPEYAALYGIIAAAVDGQKVAATILTPAGTVTVDMRDGAVQRLLIPTSDLTIALDGKKTGRRVILLIKNTSGATRTITWPGSNFAWASAAVTSIGDGKWAWITLQSVYLDAGDPSLVIATGTVAP